MERGSTGCPGFQGPVPQPVSMSNARYYKAGKKVFKRRGKGFFMMWTRAFSDPMGHGNQYESRAIIRAVFYMFGEYHGAVELCHVCAGDGGGLRRLLCNQHFHRTGGVFCRYRFQAVAVQESPALGKCC